MPPLPESKIDSFAMPMKWLILLSFWFKTHVKLLLITTRAKKDEELILVNLLALRFMTINPKSQNRKFKLRNRVRKQPQTSAVKPSTANQLKDKLYLLLEMMLKLHPTRQAHSVTSTSCKVPSRSHSLLSPTRSYRKLRISARLWTTKLAYSFNFCSP